MRTLALRYPVFEAAEFNMKVFNLILEKEEDESESSDGLSKAANMEGDGTCNGMAMNEEEIDCWLDNWDMQIKSCCCAR
ncbi:hypothetical protein OIU78_027906 [Salix suchowensis]|uniref:Uncharacterized protein n=1 Tax=Salix koriyanagi TaxID=2511006 RepID=A0A9Q1A3L5_9ROSI|nr:hypothetical protein OIU78_027906 [Salix suchowensis]KAJ6756973.1 hypothetical protein OIU74_026269 [Salix koriyanagi]